jgi:hypothetical protein
MRDFQISFPALPTDSVRASSPPSLLAPNSLHTRFQLCSLSPPIPPWDQERVRSPVGPPLSRFQSKVGTPDLPSACRQVHAPLHLQNRLCLGETDLGVDVCRPNRGSTSSEGGCLAPVLEAGGSLRSPWRLMTQRARFKYGRTARTCIVIGCRNVAQAMNVVWLPDDERASTSLLITTSFGPPTK